MVLTLLLPGVASGDVVSIVLEEEVSNLIIKNVMQIFVCFRVFTFLKMSEKSSHMDD